MTFTCAKYDADLINISKVTSRKTKWPQFFWPTRYMQIFNFRDGHVTTFWPISAKYLATDSPD